MLADTPPPPYYAVIFSSVKREPAEGYSEMAVAMHKLATEQPGFLGVESAREEVGITVSYWKDTASIIRWKQQSDHLFAQKMGREQWYAAYKTRICRVERDYAFTR